MVAQPTIRERAILDLLRERYEDEGYAFFVYPSPSLVPAFLEDFRPDAIAVGRGGGIVIEVKQSHGPRRESSSKIADRFRSQDRWKHLVVYSDDYAPEALLPAPSRQDVERRLGEVEQLLQGGHTAAALVLGWGQLEAAARLSLGAAEGAAGRPRSAAQLAEWLEREGFVDPQVSAGLRRMVNVRNAVAHGDLSRDVDRRDVEMLVQAVKGLVADQLEAPAAE